ARPGRGGVGSDAVKLFQPARPPHPPAVQVPVPGGDLRGLEREGEARLDLGFAVGRKIQLEGLGHRQSEEGCSNSSLTFTCAGCSRAKTTQRATSSARSGAVNPA